VNKETKVNYYRNYEDKLKDEFERLINKLKPEMIFIPLQGYNYTEK